jgi:hypothetical protein
MAGFDGGRTMRQTESMKNPVWRSIGENTGKVFINLGQLVFGSLVLGTTIKGSLDAYVLLIAGSVTAFVLLIAGILLVSTNVKKE